MNFNHKLVAIINKDLEPGVAMNTIAHMVLGLGSSQNSSSLKLELYG